MTKYFGESLAIAKIFSLQNFVLYGIYHLIQVLKAADQENRPGERVKNMVVHLDSCLTKRADMMEKLLVEFEQLNIDHLVESSHVPNLVWWHRKLTNRTINDDATVSREFIII